jgi:hypothetical protein
MGNEAVTDPLDRLHNLAEDRLERRERRRCHHVGLRLTVKPEDQNTLVQVLIDASRSLQFSV